MLYAFSISLGVARNPLLITYLKCDGDEKYLWDCDFNNTDNSDFICDFYNQIAIHCGMYVIILIVQLCMYVHNINRLQFINDVWSTSIDWW